MSAALNSILDGWFTTGPQPNLLGSCCSACGTYRFPRLETLCPNPECASTDISVRELSRTGTLWSFTNACYTPPPPFVPAQPFIPYAIAAVELDAEKMIVLGQVAEGIGVDALVVGMAMELIVEPIADYAEPAGRLVWKWKPVGKAE